MKALELKDKRSDLRRLYDALRSVDFLDQLKVDELDALLAVMKKLSVRAGSVLFKQGEPGDAFYLVGSGCLELTVRKGFGTRSLGLREEGDYAGEGALLEDAPRAATLTALKDSELYLLHKDDFSATLLKNPGIAAALRRHHAKTWGRP